MEGVYRETPMRATPFLLLLAVIPKLPKPLAQLRGAPAGFERDDVMVTFTDLVPERHGLQCPWTGSSGGKYKYNSGSPGSSPMYISALMDPLTNSGPSRHD